MREKNSASEAPDFHPLQVPIEFYMDNDGRPVIVSGARRVAAMKALVGKGTSGLTNDTPILGVEVVKPTDNQ